MAIVVLDAVGLKCPQPVLKLATKALEMAPGDVLEIIGDCSTFEYDVRNCCKRLNKVILSINVLDKNKKIIRIQF